MGKIIEEYKELIKRDQASRKEEKGLKKQARALEKENKKLKAEGESNNTKGLIPFICGLAQKFSSYIEKRQPSKDNTRNL